MKNIMKKIIVLMVLGIFVLSIVPVAFAEADRTDLVNVQRDGSSSMSNEGNGMESNHENNVIDAIEVSDTKDSVDVSIGQKIDRNDKIELIKEKLRKNKIEYKNLKERLRNAQDRYEDIKEKRRNAVEKFKEEKEKLAKIRDRVNECKDDDGDDCKLIRKNLKKGVEQHLLKTNDVISQTLDKLINRIESSKVLTDDEKESLLVELDLHKVELDNLYNEVEAMTAESTAKEIKVAIKDLKNAWVEIKKTQQKAVATLISSKMEEIVENVNEKLPNRMQDRIDELASAGYDTTDLEETLVEYQEQIIKLQEKQDKAALVLAEGNVKKYKEAQKEVREQLKEMKKILREFTKEFKETKKEGVSDNDEDKTESDLEDSSDNESNDTEVDDGTEDDLNEESEGTEVTEEIEDTEDTEDNETEDNLNAETTDDSVETENDLEDTSDNENEVVTDGLEEDEVTETTTA